MLLALKRNAATDAALEDLHDDIFRLTQQLPDADAPKRTLFFRAFDNVVPRSGAMAGITGTISRVHDLHTVEVQFGDGSLLFFTDAQRELRIKKRRYVKP